MTRPTLGYWNLRGRAEQHRMLLHHLGVDFEDKQWTLGDETAAGWAQNKFSLGMQFPNLPYWKEDDVFHSGAMPILRSICRKHKPAYLGRNLKEQSHADAVVDVIYPKVDPFLGTFLMAPDYKTKMEEGKAQIRELLPVIIAAIGDNKFLCGPEPVYADFFLNWLVGCFMAYAPEVVAEFPKIGEYFAAYLALPGIAQGNASMEGMLYLPPVGWQADHMPS